jgi:hypothetical protein
MAGSKILYSSYDELYAGLETISDQLDDKIVYVKDRFIKPQTSGYRDILLNVEMGNGHIAELRLEIDEIAKVANVDHDLYEIHRTFSSAAEAAGRPLTDRERAITYLLNKETQRMYEEAMREITH